MPTNSEIEFELNGTYDAFTSTVGTDSNGKVEFAVTGDGKPLWTSGPLMKTDGSRSVKVDVRNVRRLALRVTRVDEGGRIFADWVNARLTR
jgi:NPCBM/NEW2 domain